MSKHDDLSNCMTTVRQSKAVNKVTKQATNKPEISAEDTLMKVVATTGDLVMAFSGIIIINIGGLAFNTFKCGHPLIDYDYQVNECFSSPIRELLKDFKEKNEPKNVIQHNDEMNYVEPY